MASPVLTLLVVVLAVPPVSHARYKPVPRPHHLCPAVHCACSPHLLYINCSGAAYWPAFDGGAYAYNVLDLSRISAGMRPLSHADFCPFKNLTSLTVSASGISKLSPGTFREMPGLRDLDLSRNLIGYSLGDATFVGLHSLERLNLSGSVLAAAVGAATFAPLTSLTTLDLSWGNLRRVSNETFIGLDRLRHLDLSRNVLRNVKGGSFQALAELHTLLLAGNQLFRVGNDTLLGLGKLQHLDLSHNSLINLHPAAFSWCAHLNYLSLEGHYLTVVVADLFSRVLDLQYLDLRVSARTREPVKVCPATLAALRRVRRARGVPGKEGDKEGRWKEVKGVCSGKEEEQLAKLSSKVLPWVSYCPGYNVELLADPTLNAVVEPCHCDPMSRVIDCRYRQWPIIPPVSGSLAGYETLLMDGNHHLNRISFNDLAGVPSLRTLRLASCDLTAEKVVDRAFSALRWLDVLDLTNNRLGMLRREMFEDLGELRVLLLNHSGISHLELEYPSTFAPLEGLDYLDLSWNHISAGQVLGHAHSPISYLPNLKVLVLAGLRNSRFSPLTHPSLLFLDLSHNVLTHVPADTFDQLRSLQDLDLSHNLISTFNDSAFSRGLPHLYRLTLAHNHLESIEQTGGPCQRLPLLDTIDLSHNHFTNLTPHFLSGCNRLTHIILTNNIISSIAADAFASLPNLRTLDLTGNKFEDLDADMFASLSHLNTLILQGNFFRYIDVKTFSHLQKLEHLDLRLTNMGEVEHGFLGELRNLKTLWLSRSGLTRVPTDMLANLTSLRFLEMGNNYIQDIYPEALQNLKQLQSLYLHNNQLHWIHESFRNLTQLKRLVLCGNRLEALKYFMFDIKNLIDLDLSSNNIRCISDGSFMSLNQLQLLDMSSNHLSTLSPNGFYGLHKLQNMKIDHNQIPFFINATFWNLPDLRELSIRDNVLTQLDGLLFKFNKKLGIIDATANPLRTVCAGHRGHLRRIHVIVSWAQATFGDQCFIYGWYDRMYSCSQFWHRHTSRGSSMSTHNTLILLHITVIIRFLLLLKSEI